MSDSPVLVKLVSQIEDARKTSQMDPSDGPPQMFAGREMAQRVAVADLERLSKEYSNALPALSAYFMLEGDSQKQSEFGALAEDEANAIAVDMTSLWGGLVDQATKGIGCNGEFGIAAYSLITNEVRRMLRRLDLPSQSVPFPGDRYAQSAQEVVEIVRPILYSTLGYEWMRRWVAETVANECLTTSYISSIVGVVVLNATPEEIREFGILGCGNNRTVKVPDNVNRESTIKTLRKAMKKEE